MRQKILLSKLMLLLLVLVGGVGAAWAADVTITIAQSDAGLFYESSSSSTTVHSFEKDGVGFAITGSKTKSGANATTGYGYIMLMGGQIYNTSALDGKYISNIKVSYTSNTGTSGRIIISKGNSVLSTRVTTGGTAPSKSGSHSLSNDDESISYFNISNTNTSNTQISKIEITFKDKQSASSATVTTTTIDDSGITNTNVYTGTTAGSLSASVSANGNPVSGATVTWSSSDPNVATVDANGAVTLVAAGTVTFTANYAGVTDEYQASSATYVMNVTNTDPNAPGSENNPYTVAQALEASASNGVYVRGIVSRVASTSVTSNGQIRYFISDDGTTSNELNVYNGLGLNRNPFTSLDDIQVGDIVVVCGNISEYSGDNQLNANNYLVSWTRKTVSSIALSGTYTTTFVEGSEFNHEGVVVTATYSDESTAVVTAQATFSEPDMTQVGQQTITVTYSGKTATYTINITAAPTHTAKFIVNGNETTQDFKEGAAITFPSNPADIAGKTFVGWADATINGTTDTAPSFVTSATMGNADVTYYAVFATKTAGSQIIVTDVLTQTTTGITGTDYTAFTGKTANSSAVYAGQCAGDYGSIQLRSKDSNSGVISTTSGGKLKKVTVVWNSNTASGRTLDVYGNNNAYTSATDLYATGQNSNQGTKLGSIAYGTSTELTISGDYQNIGLRSNSGAMYLTSISIEWETGTPDTYSDYCTTVLTTGTITLNSACNDDGVIYGTFYTDRAYVMPEKLDGSVVSVDSEGKLTVDAVYEGSKSDVVPARMALLIKSNETFTGTRDYTINYTNDAGDDYSEFNMLKGTLTADEMTVGDDCLFYRLTMHNGTKIGFWWGAEDGGAFKPGANKAYLAVPNSVQTARISGFSFDSDNTTTAIENINRESKTNGSCYNLNGQRVNANMKGIVIVNGKKMINK